MWNSNHSADRQEQRGQPGLKEQVGLARVNVPAGYWSEKVSETRNQRYIAEGAPFFLLLPESLGSGSSGSTC